MTRSKPRYVKRNADEEEFPKKYSRYRSSQIRQLPERIIGQGRPKKRTKRKNRKKAKSINPKTSKKRKTTLKRKKRTLKVKRDGCEICGKTSH